MKSAQTSEVINKLRAFTGTYVTLLIFSISGPVMYLITPIFAQQVTDRVANSRNTITLTMLAFFALFILVMHGVMTYMRARTLQRVGNVIDDDLSSALFVAFGGDAKNQANGAFALAFQDVNTIRDFMSGSLMTALLDGFWAPLFVIFVFFIHPVLGLLGVGILVVSVTLTILAARTTRNETNNAQVSNTLANEYGAAAVRSLDAIAPLGMLPNVQRRWQMFHKAALGWQNLASSRSQIYQTMHRTLHMAQPVIIYSVGGFLYLANQVSLGHLLVAMIVIGRGNAPIEQVISNWRVFANVRSSITRLDELFIDLRSNAGKLALPALSGDLDVSRIVGGAPEGGAPLVKDVSFTVRAGKALAIIGSSGAGKSSLSRMLVGRWQVSHGEISVGGHALKHYNHHDLGRHIGYVPQDIELLPGTIYDNIARFDDGADVDDAAVLEAARVSGVSAFAKQLPDGLMTQVGTRGRALSGGQRQLVALARAIYGKPHLIVMDEPSSSLDANGDGIVGTLIRALKEKGCVVVVITHKPSLLPYCDNIMVLNSGVVQALGGRDEILRQMAKPAPAPARLALVEGTSKSAASEADHV